MCPPVTWHLFISLRKAPSATSLRKAPVSPTLRVRRRSRSAGPRGMSRLQTRTSPSLHRSMVSHGTYHDIPKPCGFGTSNHLDSPGTQPPALVPVAPTSPAPAVPKHRQRGLAWRLRSGFGRGRSIYPRHDQFGTGIGLPPQTPQRRHPWLDRRVPWSVWVQMSRRCVFPTQL